MVGGYRIIDLTMIDTSGGSIPASADGKVLYDTITKALHGKKPVAFRLRDGADTLLVSNYVWYGESNKICIIYGERISPITEGDIMANYNSAIGIKIADDGAITPIYV